MQLLQHRLSGFAEAWINSCEKWRLQPFVSGRCEQRCQRPIIETATFSSLPLPQANPKCAYAYGEHTPVLHRPDCQHCLYLRETSASFRVFPLTEKEFGPVVTRKDVWVGSSLAKEELKRCSLPRLEYWRKFLTGGSHSGVSVCVIGRAGKDTTHSIPSLTPSFQSELRIYHLQSTSPRICSSDWRNNEKATDTQKEATVFCYSGVLPAKDSHWGTFS